MEKVSFSRCILVTASLLVLAVSSSHGQQSVGKETLGIEYFQQGNFEKALPIFAKLAQSYPDNAMYNYYYGVSLIKNNIFETAAKEALLNSVVDKTPSNANFYLGNYFHALGQWQEAQDFYDRYEKLGSKQEKKALRFEYFVDLCKQKNNPFKPQKSVDTALFGDTLRKAPPTIDEKNFPIPEALKRAWFNFQVNEFLAYHAIGDFKSEASKILFIKAWMCTGRNDSIVALTDSLRKVHDGIVRVDTRLGIVQQIVDCEQKSYQLMRDREKFLDQSRVKESAYWEREGEKAATAYNAIIQERENRLIQSRKKEEAPKQVPIVAEVKKDSATTVAAKPDKVTTETAVKTVQEVPVYKVQIGSFKNGILSPVFKTAYAKISKLRKIDKFTDAKKQVVFTVGNFRNSTDAVKMRDQLIREGMKGAKVVDFGKNADQPVKAVAPPVKTDPAKSNNPSVQPSGEAVKTGGAVENLIFKVQIGSFKNGVITPGFKKTYDRISKLTKIDKYTNANKYEIFTVGNFVNYDDASKMKDQMIREGIKDAFLAAFHNGERIKVSEALKLAGGK